MTQNQQIALKSRLDMAKRVVMGSPMTLARHGIDAEQFASVVREAILTNPDILGASESSLAQAFRRCCRDGLVPDGDSAAIVVYKGQARMQPMVTGLKQMAYEALNGAEIRSGVVYEGDDVQVQVGAGIEQKLVIRSDGNAIFKTRKGTDVIGAWCTIKIPGEDTARLTLLSKDEIERSRASSFAQKDGPWKKWYDRMAEKSAVKRACRDLRYMFTSNQKAQDFFENQMQDETFAEPIDAQAEDVKDLPQITEAQVAEKEMTVGKESHADLKPAETAKPKPKPKPRKAADSDAKVERAEPHKESSGDREPEAAPETETPKEPVGNDASFLPADGDDDDPYKI